MSRNEINTHSLLLSVVGTISTLAEYVKQLSYIRSNGSTHTYARNALKLFTRVSTHTVLGSSFGVVVTCNTLRVANQYLGFAANRCC